jgi:phospholipid/cholesterol/gamma-HCH transport system substrate-binding protein
MAPWVEAGGDGFFDAARTDRTPPNRGDVDVAPRVAGAGEMRGNMIETVMGGVVLVIAALFLFFAYSTSQLRAVSGYPVTAQFQSVEGIRDGSDVRIAGVKVGSVSSETLDPRSFLVTVKMSIGPQYKLPDDTVAEIISSSLLGDKFMSLVPGGSDKDIPPGGEIKFTQAPVSLENLIGQMIFSQPGGGGQKKPGEGGGEAPAAGGAAGAGPQGTAPGGLR